MATDIQSREYTADEIAEITIQPLRDISEYFKQYVRQHPEAACLWCLGIGFALGWKLKPW